MDREFIKKTFLSFCKEASNCIVTFDGDTFDIGFNTYIRDVDYIHNYSSVKNFSSLIINDFELFLDKLIEYVELEIKCDRKKYMFVDDDIKFIIASLFVNATTEDFVNPIRFIDRYIKYLEDDTFKDFNLDLDLNSLFPNVTLNIKNSVQSIMMETPNKMSFSFINDDGETYLLPDISYAISNDTCYIYSILDRNKDRKGSSFKKMINRSLYKINSGVDSDIPEIKDVSVSSVLSLFIFLNLLNKKGITKIKGVPYLPVRYCARYNFALNKDNKEELLKRNNLIQSNLTDKFINTFRRVEYHLSGVNMGEHFSGFKFELFPYMYDEFITYSLTDDELKTDNEYLDHFNISKK